MLVLMTKVLANTKYFNDVIFTEINKVCLCGKIVTLSYKKLLKKFALLKLVSVIFNF